MSVHLGILAAGMAVDRLVGDPDWLWQRWSHPVVAVGAVIDRLDRGLNRSSFSPGTRKAAGAFVAGSLLFGGLFLGLVVSAVLGLFGPLGWAAEALLLAIFLAQKSLIDHVRKVAFALDAKGLVAGRRAVSMIVGRDPEQLDEAGICRAAIESLAENASDGVVAPVFWFLLLGLPGLFAYKAINTADSMIGHMNTRYQDFGWASAKLDDLVNWPAARLTAVLFALAGDLQGAIKGERTIGMAAILAVTRRDACLHRSPNAGWPEVAMGAVLGLSFGGPRRYGDLVVDAPVLNAGGRHEATTSDIEAAVSLFKSAMNLCLGAIGVVWLISLA